MSEAACDEAGIRSLLLHAGSMVFWQSVEMWDDSQLRCHTSTHLDPNHPLKRDGLLSSIHLAEYGAQMMAIHGSLLARMYHGGAVAPGVLASLRDFEMRRPRIDDIAAPLTGTARLLVAGASGSIYEFEISSGAQVLGSGRVSVITLPSGTATN